jgi:hypothetical protein
VGENHGGYGGGQQQSREASLLNLGSASTHTAPLSAPGKCNCLSRQTAYVHQQCLSYRIGCEPQPCTQNALRMFNHLHLERPHVYEGIVGPCQPTQTNLVREELTHSSTPVVGQPGVGHPWVTPTIPRPICPSLPPTPRSPPLPPQQHMRSPTCSQPSPQRSQHMADAPAY